MKLNTRRKFLLAGFAGSVVLLSINSTLFGGVTPLSVLSQVQDDLFPQNKDVPTKKQINAKAYLALVLNHEKVTQSDKEFIKNSVVWLNEESHNRYKTLYTKLNPQQRQDILKEIAQYSWGKSFISDMLKYNFEAMLGDPIYGINKDESGWKWLHHQAGLPRPKVAYL